MADANATRRIPSPMILAELLRLQRWAGGDTVSAGKIFGLMHGFESVIKRERESFGISRELQDRVEDILQDVEEEKQSAGGHAIKERLLRDDIDETVAGKVIELCRLESRFTEAVEKLTAQDSHFRHLASSDQPESQWVGALHWIELVDCTEDAEKPLHACHAAAVPRVGEVVTPENGSPMRVVAVEHVMMRQGEDEGQRQRVLVPHVYLEAIEDEDE